jgi:hypothetical protein
MARANTKALGVGTSKPKQTPKRRAIPHLNSLWFVQSTNNSNTPMRRRSVVGPNMHLLKPWSRPGRISCSALPHCDKTHW